MYTWHEYGHPAVAARAQADAVAIELQEALNEKGHAVLTVSGGRSPIAFFDALSQKDLDWANVSIGLADERIVPTGHPDSNTRLVREHLLQNKAAAAQWIAVVEDGRTEIELQPAVVVDYALKQYKHPDVLVLGMGTDGHTASLFPQAPQYPEAINLENNLTLIHTTPVTAPHERVSMTLDAVLNTRHVFLAIQGADKKAVFDKAAQEPNEEYPISLILNNERVDCHVFYAP